MATQPWAYLETTPAPNAPVSDNLSGMYCPDCRVSGVSHCAHPEWCGGMELMRSPTPSLPSGKGEKL